MIINCTPLGTYPDINDAPEFLIIYLLLNIICLILFTILLKTKFLAWVNNRALVIQNGYEMLVLQAEENWKIWNN